MIKRLFLLGFVGVVSAACATKQDVSRLETTMLEEIRDMADRQDAILAQLGIAFDSLGTQGRRDLAGRGELQRQFDSLGDQIAQVMALVSQNNQLLNELQAGRSTTAVVPIPGGGEVTGAGGRDEPSLFYGAAQEQFRRGSYATARSGFEDFLANYPDDDLAPDAQYFLAETYAAESDAVRALQEYARVLELYPESRRAPTALYKSGMLELERGNTGEARRFFERVELGYPDSPEAELARDQLSKLRS